MASKSAEVWMSHFAVSLWNNAAMWDSYFRDAETILEDQLSILDSKDPARRKVANWEAAGSFIVDFGLKQDSRWIFGKFRKSAITFTIQHYKTGFDSFGRRRANEMNIYFPAKCLEAPLRERQIRMLFELGNGHLKSFYGVCDEKGVYCAKKPSSPRLTISLTEELLGVMWLTYFGDAYRHFFTIDRLHNLPTTLIETPAGVTLQLAESPGLVPVGLRGQVEQTLGHDTFAGTTGARKEHGQHALSLEQLSGTVNEANTLLNDA